MNPVDICPVRKEIMAFSSLFFPLFPEWTKPMLTQVITWIWLGKGAFTVETEPYPLPVPSIT